MMKDEDAFEPLIEEDEASSDEQKDTHTETETTRIEQESHHPLWTRNDMYVYYTPGQNI